MTYRTGHSKFWLSHQKYEERKKFSQVTSLPVSIPLNEEISVFKVSVLPDLLYKGVSTFVSSNWTSRASQTKLTKALPAGMPQMI